MGISKRGQVSETMNWVIATIIIIIVLLVCFFIAKGELLKTSWTFSDKQKDFAATKSIIAFVDENSALIENSIKKDNYSEFDKTFNTLLEVLYVNVCKDYCFYDGAWGVTLRFAGDTFVKHTLIINPLAESEEYYGLSFIFPINDKKLNVKFSKQSGWINL